MPQLTGPVTRYPARVSLLWYAGLVTVGTVLLYEPISQTGNNPVTVLDALFTSTSATCVTGLVVRSTGNDFTWFGQLVILGLIQLGGLGIMTFTTLITLHLGGGSGLRQRALLAGTLGTDYQTDLRWILRRVIAVSLKVEGLGFLILAVRNIFERPLGEALWHALFHSVSAYCNAGFALYDDSLERYRNDPLVNLTIMGLIICGGLGFPVLFNLQQNWFGPWRQRWERLNLHSKMMLLGTAILLVFGTASILVLEWDGELADMPVAERVLVALFQSVTCRTAGFNTIPIGSLTNASLFIMILLMMIGAGPCSTAGGFKVSTLMVLVSRGWATFHGLHHVRLFRRTLAPDLVVQATATAAVFTLAGITALTALLVAEQSDLPHAASQGVFLESLFEVMSALGTVGLSTGFTTKLTVAGRVVVIVLMFLGRLGPISVAAALSRGERPSRIEYPQETLLIG